MMNLRTAVMVAALAPLASGASAQVTQPGVAPQVTPDPMVLENQVVLAGTIGSSFGDAVDDASFNFGGSLSYLWQQWIGAEFVAGFTPNFGFAEAGEPNVNTYMANAIAALPLGLDGRWQPFLSGGIGAMQLRGADEEFFVAPDQTSLGGNIGVGLMGFADRWGFRADVRRYSQLGDADDNELLNDLAFWRGNVGIAYRW